jgi:hypothetical protein
VIDHFQLTTEATEFAEKRKIDDEVRKAFIPED